MMRNFIAFLTIILLVYSQKFVEDFDLENYDEYVTYEEQSGEHCEETDLKDTFEIEISGDGLNETELLVNSTTEDFNSEAKFSSNYSSSSLTFANLFVIGYCFCLISYL